MLPGPPSGNAARLPMTPQMDALVTAADIPSSVAGIRALGRAGLRVLAAGPRRTAAGFWSRYAAGRALCPDGPVDPEGFVARVAELAERHGPLVVYPGQDEGLSALMEAADRLPEQAVLPYPGAAPLAVLRDKRRLADLAATQGMDSPATLLVGRAADLVAGDLPDGAVVKPARPGGAFRSVRVADAAASVRAVLTEAPGHEELVLQERLTGRLMAVSVVVGRDGELVRRFQQVAIRTWPEDAGISSLAVSVEPDEDLAEASRRLLASAGYWGLAQLQFIDTAGGPRLIDVNTRFYGSLALALASGVDLPPAWHDVVVGRPAGSPGPYTVGVTYRWLEADIIAATRGVRGRLFSRAPRPRTGPMWAGDDPVASLMFGFAAIEAAVRWRLRRTADG